jgi:protein TonB
MERSSRNDLILAGTIAVLLHAALALWQIPVSRSMYDQEAKLAEAMTVNLVAKRPAAVVTPLQGSPEPTARKEPRSLPETQETAKPREIPKPETPVPDPALELNEPTLLSPVQTAPSAAPLPAAPQGPEAGSSRAGAGQQTAALPAFVESRPPAYGQRQDPEYPEGARRRGYQGTALLRVRVREDGRVAAVEIKESSGYRILDGTATKAIWTWRFTPALADGRPVASWVLVPVTFRLQ